MLVEHPFNLVFRRLAYSGLACSGLSCRQVNSWEAKAANCAKLVQLAQEFAEQVHWAHSL